MGTKFLKNTSVSVYFKSYHFRTERDPRDNVAQFFFIEKILRNV